jgi:ABC-type branched-subunit amino acid transport system substrate-binding protein
MHRSASFRIIPLLLFVVWLSLDTCASIVTASVASTYQIYHRIAPNISLPNVASIPTVEIANSLPLTGGYASLGMAALQSITLWLQLANSRGGVYIQGQQHYFAYTYIDDGTSPGML